MPDSPENQQIPDCAELEAAIEETTSKLAQQEFDLSVAENDAQAAAQAERNAFADWEKAAEARNDNSKKMAEMADHAYDETSIIIGKPRYTPAFKALADKQPGLDKAAEDAWKHVEECRQAHDAARARVRQLQADVAATKAWLEQLRAAAERCGLAIGDVGSRVKLKLAALIVLIGTIAGGFLFGGHASAHDKHDKQAVVTPSTTVTTFEDGLPLPPLPPRFRTTTTVAPSTTVTTFEDGLPLPPRPKRYVTPTTVEQRVTQPPTTSATMPQRRIVEPPPIEVTTTTTTVPRRELG